VALACAAHFVRPLVRQLTRQAKPAGPVGWFVATTEDAKKPAQFPVGAGHGAVNTTMMALLSAGAPPSASSSVREESWPQR